MKTKLVRIAAFTFTLVTIGYMSISMSADTTAVGGKGLSVGAKENPAPASSIEDQTSGGGAPVQLPKAKEEGGCCSKSK
ncbi:MAG TPA: hypothetical protein PL037_08085 [Elusimicrobiales bacterium]|nr:hypothetical protein [Elusimicrobiales bacterium]